MYNYVYNNCATKIRDVLVSILGERLKFDNKTESKSFRNFMDMYLENNKWGDLGIDICLGSAIDNKVSYSDQMFLPEYLNPFFNFSLVLWSKIFVPYANVNSQSHNNSPFSSSSILSKGALYKFRSPLTF